MCCLLVSQVQSLRDAGEKSEARAVELESERQDLLAKLAGLAEVEAEVKALQELRSEVTELETARETLKNNFDELKVRLKFYVA